MNAKLAQAITTKMYLDSLRLTELIGEVDLLLLERAAQVEALRRGIEIGGEYLIYRPGLSVQRITVQAIGGTERNLKLQYAKRAAKGHYVVTVTPDTRVERV